MEDDDFDGDTTCCCFYIPRKSPKMMEMTSTRRKPTDALTVNVTPFICDVRRGRVSIEDISSRDILVEWTNLPEDANVTRNGLVVENLLPCRIHGNVFYGGIFDREIFSNVHALESGIIIGYTTRACTAFPWNGEVLAHVQNCPKGSRFLWNNGVVTSSPILSNARPGTYTVTIIDCACVIMDISSPAIVENSI
jgi:hypothetical protein